MKLTLIAAAALISLSIAGVAGAAPSTSYAAPHGDIASAEFIDAKFKFKKFGHSRSFRRGHFGGSRFGHRSFRGGKHGHFGKGGNKKGHRGKTFFFGKGVILK